MADNVSRIKQHLGEFFSKESELAKAELVPSLKSAGKGTGLMVVALGFVLHAAWMLVIALSAVFTWLFTLTGLSLALSLVFGFLMAAVLALLIAALFALFGLRSFKKVKAPKATIAEFSATVDAIAQGFGRKEDDHLPAESRGLGDIDAAATNPADTQPESRLRDAGQEYFDPTRPDRSSK